MDIACSICHRPLRVPDHVPGGAIRCPYCQSVLQVAGVSLATAPTAAPPVPSDVPRIAATGTEWNVWDLERAVRERGASDPERVQEWNMLLLNLRQYASAEGTLSSDFDELVRESFGELLESRSGP